MLLLQARYLETWIQGGIDLRVTRKEGTPHLQLFDDRWHTYCDMALHAVPPVTEKHKDVPQDLCGECLTVFRQLVSEAEDRLVPKLRR